MTHNDVIWSRKILHMDMDAFFAAVEQRDHPEYRGKPLIVGGSPQSRGVVSTASYEARKFGVRSAMSSAQAKRLCPQGIFVSPRFEAYQKASRDIMAIFRQHTPLVEPASLDEAYLDVSRHRFGIEDPVMIARMIKQNVFAVTKLTVSAGVAPNMFLAKVASDIQKPDGLTVVYPHLVAEFLRPLSVRKIPGVGPVTEKALNESGIFKCHDLEEAGESFLKEHFGKYGAVLYQKSLGLDEREVETEWESKQLSTEETYEKDTKNLFFLKARLQSYAEEVFHSLKNEGRMGKTVTVKVKYSDFESVTRSQTLQDTPTQALEIYQVASRLLLSKTEAGKRPIRLLGLGISGLQSGEIEKNQPAKSLQKELFEV